MPFPDAEHAIVAEEKICDYLLNTDHPVGGSKAAWFASIGYTLANWQQLAEELLQLATARDDFIAKPSLFGVKYEVTGEIGRPGYRPATVVSVWIVEEDASPRLVTAYPG